MKKYKYQVLEQTSEENDTNFLERVNRLAERGYKYLIETISDGGKGRVVMEKEWSDFPE